MNIASPPTATCVADESAESSADPDPGEQRLIVSCDLDADDAPSPLSLRDHMAAALAELDVADATLSVIVIDDARMADLHERFSGVAGTTDVLTFDLRDDADQPIEGEVYICLDEARRRAAERGHATDKELLLYAVHGLLHLMGYDDHDETGYAAMHEREDHVLQAIGVGKVFGT